MAANMSYKTQNMLTALVRCITVKISLQHVPHS